MGCIDISYIYDQIYQKRGHIHAQFQVSLLYSHSTDTTKDHKFMLVPLPKLQRSAFTESSFTLLRPHSQASLVSMGV